MNHCRLAKITASLATIFVYFTGFYFKGFCCVLLALGATGPLASVGAAEVKGPELEFAVRVQLLLDEPLWISGSIAPKQPASGLTAGQSSVFSRIRNLSMEAGTTGAFRIQDGAQADGLTARLRMLIEPRQSLDRLGVEFHYKGSRDEILELRLKLSGKPLRRNPAGSASANDAAATELDINIDIPIADLISGVVDQKLANGVRLWVGRPGGDTMRVTMGSGDAMVFAAGQEIPLAVDVLAAPSLVAKSSSELNASRVSSADGRVTYQTSFRAMELRLELVNDATGAVVWQHSAPIEVSNHSDLFAGIRAALFNGPITLPTQEGVYTLRSRILPSGAWRMVERITRPEILTRPGLLARPDLLLAEDAFAERSTQIVVLEPLPPPIDPTPMKEVARWTPSERSWLGLEAHPLSSTKPIETTQHLGQTVARLAPDSQISQTIKVAENGRPHLLIVRYVREQPVKMTVAIRQKDKAGNWNSIGVDTAVIDDWNLDRYPQAVIGGSAIANDLQVVAAAGKQGSTENQDLIAEHRVLFWPSGDQPLLILRNENELADLKIESISVMAGPARLAGGVTAKLASLEPEEAKRLAAVYLDKPLLTDVFGCEKQVDTGGRIALDDWNTFLQAGTRLVDYVQACGANGAVISAISEGGALYPTQRMTPTARYDTGVFFADGRDPLQKDVLELMYRLFERAGLKLVVSIEFATPLPEIENLLADIEAGESKDAESLTWVDHLGRPYLDQQPARRGVGAFYNVCDSRIEAQLSSLVGELVQRYSRNPSFAGVGLRLGTNSMLQLPPPSYGRDAATLRKFISTWQADRQNPNGDGKSLHHSQGARGGFQDIPSTIPALNVWLDREGKDHWVRWRANRLTTIYQQLAERLSGAPLYLITADYRPANAEMPGGDAIQLGIDWAQLASTPNVVPLRLMKRRYLVEPARRIADARQNEDMVLNEMLRLGRHSRTHSQSSPQRTSSESLEMDATSGGLLYFPPEPLPIRLKSDTNTTTSLTLFPQATTAAPNYLRDLSQFVETMDSQVILVGGWTPSIAPTPAVAAWFRSFSVLPRKRFRDVEPPDAKSAVVRVRQCSSNQGVWVYAVNTAPWPVAVNLFTDAAAGSLIRQYGAEERVYRVGMDTTSKNSSGATPEQSVAGRTAALPDGLSSCWNGVLEPGQLVVLELVGNARGIGRWSATPLADPLPELAARLDDLTARVSILGQPRVHDCLINGGFESVALRGEIGQQAVQIDNWMRSQHPINCVEVTRDAIEGQHAILLRTDDNPGSRTWLLSTPLNAPGTGRLAVSIRAKTVSGNPTLRLAVEGRARSSVLRYSVNLQPESGAARQTDGTASLTNVSANQWPEQTYWLYVTDLPDGPIEDLRIAIDLVSSGQVAIDDVRFFDFFFTLQERDQLQRQTFVAAERLSKGDLTAAVRLLDSHWARYLRWLEMPNPEPLEAASKVGRITPNERLQSSGPSWRDNDAPAVPTSSTAQTPQGSIPAPNHPTPSIADRIRQYLPAPLRF